MNNNIILIGMPGSGKSTLGVLLAKYSCYSFVDLDLIINKKAGKKLQKILDEDGYDAFLKIENAVAEELDCEKTVVATGGSMVLSPKGMEHLKELGTVVYINVPLDEIKRRVTNVKTRGIAFRDGETLDDVFKERTPLYEKYADVTVDFENASNLEKTVDKIIEKLNLHK